MSSDDDEIIFVKYAPSSSHNTLDLRETSIDQRPESSNSQNDYKYSRISTDQRPESSNSIALKSQPEDELKTDKHESELTEEDDEVELLGVVIAETSNRRSRRLQKKYAKQNPKNVVYVKEINNPLHKDVQQTSEFDRKPSLQQQTTFVPSPPRIISKQTTPTSSINENSSFYFCQKCNKETSHWSNGNCIKCQKRRADQLRNLSSGAFKTNSVKRESQGKCTDCKQVGFLSKNGYCSSCYTQLRYKYLPEAECRSCSKFVRIEARGMCRSCHMRKQIKSKNDICIKCNQMKTILTRGMCALCYKRNLID